MKDTDVHVNYDIHRVDVNGVTMNELEIVTPLALLVVAYAIATEDLEELVCELRDEFHYNPEEMVSVKIPGSRFDFILITESIVSSRVLGCVNAQDENNETVSGHELEVTRVVKQFSEDKGYPFDKDNGITIPGAQVCLGDDECNIPGFMRCIDDGEIEVLSNEESGDYITTVYKCEDICLKFHMLKTRMSS